jgi:hypothetical protein
MDVRRTARSVLVPVLVSWATGCPGDDADTGIDEETSGTTADDDGDGDGDTGVGADGLLGCPSGEVCTLVLVSQTLDDRVEIFAPDDPGGNPFRGTIDIDLKPNDDGDIGEGRLDEPFGLALAGGHLHVLVGHYPSRDSGSLVSFPFSFLEGFDVGQTIPVGGYYDEGTFSAGVSGVGLGEEEPIYMLHHGERLLVGVFNNDLFTVESEWTNPGKLLVVDPADPSQFGVRDLVGLDGGSCDGAGQIVDIGGGRVAVACDGNDAVAFLDVSAIQTGDPSVAAATITGNVCSLPVASERRVRHLAPDGTGGVLVAVGPGGLSALGASDLHHVDANTCFRAAIPVGSNGQAQLGHIVMHGSGTWLLASGAGQLTAGGMRGVYAVHDSGAGPRLCEAPLGGFEAHWETPGQPVDPYALALTDDGRHLAVGASPVNSEASDGIYGRVLWASLPDLDDPCAATADVADLTAGTLAPSADRVSSWRRGPDVVTVVQVRGQ